MSPPPRTASGRRVYDSTDLRILVFIRRPRELGFSLVEIRELLRLGEPEKASCREVREIAVAWAGEAIFAATTASPSESKPIGQTSGHNNGIPEPRRLPHTQPRDQISIACGSPRTQPHARCFTGGFRMTARCKLHRPDRPSSETLHRSGLTCPQQTAS